MPGGQHFHQFCQSIDEISVVFFLFFYWVSIDKIVRYFTLKWAVPFLFYFLILSQHTFCVVITHSHRPQLLLDFFHQSNPNGFHKIMENPTALAILLAFRNLVYFLFFSLLQHSPSMHPLVKAETVFPQIIINQNK